MKLLFRGKEIEVNDEFEANWFINEKGAELIGGDAKLNVSQRIDLINAVETIDELDVLAQNEKAVTAIAAIEVKRKELQENS